MVPTVTATGVEKVACCQPEADSDVKVAVTRSWPLADHSAPTWVPVFVVAL